MATRTPQREWLDVAFGQKDEAKAAGARWDPEAKRWYAPRPGMRQLERWAARPEVPDLLPGEDRNLGSGLYVDLVPDTCWFTNVRSCVAPGDWERLRRMVVGRAGARCEVCGAREDRDVKRWLEAHERWQYDEARRVQRLGRLILLCSPCHQTTHFGLARVRGEDRTALAHLIDVTGMDIDDAIDHVDAAFEVWKARSGQAWELDLSILTNAGIELAEPPAGAVRGELAIAGLEAAQRSAAAQRHPAAARNRPVSLVPPARPSFLRRLLGKS